jgi:organic hydroperoxide reductase OsmC/OhrA
VSGTRHEYRSTCTWDGSTGVGYEHYSRRHTLSLPPADVPISASADPAFRGEAAFANPEQLLLAAASSCQLLSFLAIAARARIDVVSYSDDAWALMPEDEEPVRITEIVLRPRVVVRGDIAESRILRYLGLAHAECYVANTLNCDVRLEPTVLWET